MPLVALVDGKPSLALDPDIHHAKCRDPKCAAPMYRRAPRDMKPHWSHTPGTAERCDAEHGVGKWHLDWQYRCTDPERMECRVGGRRADVLTRFGWAVEFQASGIHPDTIRDREADWKGHLLWVHEARSATAGTLTLLDRPAAEGRVFFDWIAPPRRVAYIKCHQLLDIKDGRLLWMAPRPVGKPGQDIRQKVGWLLTHEQFTDWWLNGHEPVFPPDWSTSQWQPPVPGQPRRRPAPKPFSETLKQALTDAQRQHATGEAAGSCERAITPRMAAPPAPSTSRDIVTSPAPPQRSVTPKMAMPKAPPRSPITKTCLHAGCSALGRLYPSGYWCDEHPPQPRAVA